MSKIINEKDLSAIEAIIRDDVKQRVASSQLSSDTLSFEAAFLEPMIWQIMIPMLVSVTSSFLTEKLKEKIQNNRKREDIVSCFVGREMKEDHSINKLCLKELQDLIDPLGFQEDDIKSIYDKLLTHLKS